MVRAIQRVSKIKKYWELQSEHDALFQDYRESWSKFQNNEITDKEYKKKTYETLTRAGEIEGYMYRLSCAIGIKSLEVLKHQAHRLNVSVIASNMGIDEAIEKNDMGMLEWEKQHMIEVENQIIQLKDAVWQSVLNSSKVMDLDKHRVDTERFWESIGL